MIYVFYEKLPFYDLSSHKHKFIKDEVKPVMRKNTTYGDTTSFEIKARKKGESRYNPPLPVSVIKNGDVNEEYEGLYGELKTPEYISNNIERNKLRRKYKKEGKSESAYDPPLPNTTLEIKSTRGKHRTEKPVELISWILKYYSKEGDLVLDPTMGGGSTIMACKNMNRKFIGIEMDTEIFKGVVERLK